ncbi:GNAT family N-acetyltransferase [Agromyces aerolatus]|uniref:GNAT family N-acetyltransferase n=1 Tax=Agromyces sp. LY-1074 TaxID=3074080 RepID=UPI00285B67C7|nr:MULTISPECIES: GNAT family N-acetyltransferase [unclassified Agromyces]MDR5698628.1 GNAT family N-acetyltransferase [Agromyces sp. LY-1074]MDR5704922.1 GNAT family N-acetyltransferase [Agromyces sp. LY-1358]
MNHPVSVAVEPPRQPEIERLLEGSTTYAQSLGYPPEANFLLDVSQLERPGVRVFVARDGDGAALGIAALVDDVAVASGSAELKRMFVADSARGRGVAGRLLQAIETDATSRGLRQIVLETGTLHLPAQALYAKHGYRRIPAFGQYVGEPYSVCMAKDLGEPRP